ncbi:MAG: endonuclease [Actinomycetia bacterium]|nr:endonuclease [Actinomycetes bacterium]
MMNAALDYLNRDFLAGPGGTGLDSAGLAGADLGGVLESLGVLSAKFAAARSAILARFDAARGHDADGYGSSAAWLAAKGRTTRRAANAEVRRMRQFRAHPVIAAAVARGELSEDWAAQIADYTRKLPPDWRDDVDRLLVDTAAAGAALQDLAIVAQAAWEKWRQQQGPDPDDGDDGFDDRYLKVATTIDGAGRINGNLTGECAAAVQAVLEALGKKAGPEDDRTEAQRYHDALQQACELLLRAQLVPDRAGAGTRADVIIALSQLRSMPGAPEVEHAYLAALAGEHGYLSGAGAQATACDAITTPVVTGHPDLTVVDTMIAIVLAYLDTTDSGTTGNSGTGDGGTGDGGTGGSGPDWGSGPAAGHGDPGAGGQGSPDTGGQGSATARSRALSPEAWQALRYAIARLAIDLASGPGGIASVLRRSLLDEPFNSKSVILDVGASDSIPPHIRRAVQLRAKGCCEWPGCTKRAVYCDIHHLRHQQDGGGTSLSNCVLLCQFHHDTCIHRRNWRLILHPDATTTAYGPQGQVIHSHGPPGGQPPGNQPPGSHGPPGAGPPDG